MLDKYIYDSRIPGPKLLLLGQFMAMKQPEPKPFGN